MNTYFSKAKPKVTSIILIILKPECGKIYSDILPKLNTMNNLIELQLSMFKNERLYIFHSKNQINLDLKLAKKKLN